MTRLEKQNQQKAAARAEDAPLSPLCLVDLPHSLLVLVLRWVEALTLPGKLEDLESGSDAEACAEASRVSWLIATFLGCESLCSALRYRVRVGVGVQGLG